jgi:hypothetical protein
VGFGRELILSYDLSCGLVVLRVESDFKGIKSIFTDFEVKLRTENTLFPAV